MADLDTPPDSPAHGNTTPRNAANGKTGAGELAGLRTFSLTGEESLDGESQPGSGQGVRRPDGPVDQTVFDLTMDYSDDDGAQLLDWEQYAGMKRYRYCGLEFGWLMRCLPCLPWVPPEWWYRYSRKQRRVIVASIVVGWLLAIVLIGALFHEVTEDDVDYGEYPSCAWQGFRLPPDTVQPSAYHLQLQVQLQEPYTVDGRVDIELQVRQATPCVVLHAADMAITRASFRKDLDADGDDVIDGKVEWHQERGQVLLRFDKRLPGDKAVLSLAFQYRLAAGLEGFYRSHFVDAKGVNNTIASTQFEAGAARKAFPCFDEPGYKATFNVTLTSDTGLTALSNMPETSRVLGGTGLLTHHYAVTPPMSTYLVAFVIGNLTSVSVAVPPAAGSGAARNVSVWGTPDRAQDLQAALGYAARVLQFYEGLLGVAYALPKLDLVALPDFQAGAMENWGLVTYRETALLVPPGDQAALAVRLRVATVVAHELAHLWFGDLVTLQYWGELWLNEGFATYFEYLGAQAALADMSFPTLALFYEQDTAAALAEDAKAASTHPLAVPADQLTSSNAIEALFDSISYSKGGSVLRMLRAYLTRDAVPPVPLRRLLQAAPAAAPADQWLAGLRRYLQGHQYGSVTSADLWAALAQATNQPVADWMRRWTYQAGYPLVTVSLAGNDVHVAQAPFTMSGSLQCNASAAWWVPLSYVTPHPGGVQWHPFASCSPGEPVRALAGQGDWLKLNAGQLGLYRVNYPQRLWDSLAQAAGQRALAPATGWAISPDDFAGLLDDAFALATSEMVPVTAFLNLTRALEARAMGDWAAEYSPWAVAARHVVHVHKLLGQDETRHPGCAANWALYLQSLTQPFVGDPTANATGFVGLVLTADASTSAAEPPMLRLLRPLILSLSGRFGNSATTASAAVLLQDAAAGQPLNPDLRSVIYRLAVQGGDVAAYDTLAQLYTQAAEADERERTLGALGSAGGAALPLRSLELALSPAVRQQDTASLIVAVARSSSQGAQAAWAFLRMHWKELEAKLGGSESASRTLGRLMESVGAELASADALEQVEQLYRAHADVLQTPRYAEGAKESIQANVRWLQHNADAACEWLALELRKEAG